MNSCKELFLCMSYLQIFSLIWRLRHLLWRVSKIRPMLGTYGVKLTWAESSWKVNVPDRPLSALVCKLWYFRLLLHTYSTLGQLQYQFYTWRGTKQPRGNIWTSLLKWEVHHYSTVNDSKRVKIQQKSENTVKYFLKCSFKEAFAQFDSVILLSLLIIKLFHLMCLKLEFVTAAFKMYRITK
jgi:hypothetical protein